MPKTPKDQDKLSEAEADKRRDEIIKRMLNTPPKPHKPKSKKGAKRDRP